MRKLLVGLILVALVPVGAQAAEEPTKKGRKALRAAVKRSNLVPESVRQGEFKLRRPLVSTEGPWARATIKPTGGGLDPALGLFKRGKARPWRLVTLGTAGVGCANPRLPADVRRDLGIDC